MKLNQKTALITGGSRGIGFATAKKFLTEGANVVILDLKQEEIDKALLSLKQHKAQLAGFMGNVTSKLDASKAINYTVERFGAIDILVNNAGITADAQLVNLEEEQWEKV